LTINNVDSSNLSILLNLVQAYEAEFSLITKKLPGPNGLYALDTNLDESHSAFLLYIGISPLGFCIKATQDGIHDIAEFYIVPSHRGNNLGCEFAASIFQKYSGKWQVRQISGADKAVLFWRKAIGRFTNGNYVESIVEDSYWGKVTKQTFNSP
jgi:predicted acetyltransferase